MNNKLFISHKNTHLRFYNFILSTKKSYSNKLHLLFLFN